MRLRALELRLRVLHGLLLQRRIDAREELALLHVVVEVDVDLRDLPGHLRADLHRRTALSVPVAETVDLRDAARDRRGSIGRRLLAFGALVEPPVPPSSRRARSPR